MATRRILGLIPLQNYHVDGYQHGYPVLYQEGGNVIAIGVHKPEHRTPFGQRGIQNVDLDGHGRFDELAPAHVTLSSTPHGKIIGTVFFTDKEGREGTAGSAQRGSVREVMRSLSLTGFVPRK